MSIDLGRRLVAAGLVPPREVEAALFISIARAIPLARVLLDRGAITERALEDELERTGGLGLRRVVGATELVERLPKAMCRRLAALPTRLDPQTNTVDIVAADPQDPHIASELGFHLGTSIRVFRASIAAVEDAIRRLELEEPAADPPAPPVKARTRRVTPPFPHGAPQSSVPPPPTTGDPIPLVRRITQRPPPQFAASEDATAYFPPSSEAPSVVLPLRVVKTVQPAPQAEPEVPLPLRRPRATGQGPRDLPSISFPSEPPPGHAEPDDILRIAPPGTPAYGMPILAMPVLPVPANLTPKVTHEWTAQEVAVILSEASTPPLPTSKENVDTEPRPTIKGLPFVAPPARVDGSPDDAPRPGTPQAVEDEEEPRPPEAEGKRRTLRPPLFVPEAFPEDAMEDAMDPADPSTQPRLPRRLRAPDGRMVLEALTQTSDRDEVVSLALRGLRLVAKRLAVFAVRRDGFLGWACNVAFGDPDAFRELLVPQEMPSILATAAAASMYLGPIPRTPAHEDLLRIMEHSSLDVAAISVRVGGRAAMILVADDLEDTLLGTRWIEELARAIGEALSRLLAVKE